MDNAGWHARHQAKKEFERWSTPQRGPDGRFQPVEETHPMQEPPPGALPNLRVSIPSPQPPVNGKATTPPPRDESRSNGRTDGLPSVSPGSMWSNATLRESAFHSPVPTNVSQLTRMSAVQRSQNLRVAHMNPYLQLMTGPLLRYDTVDVQGVWRGAALIVTVDASSVYDPNPTLAYSWDPDRPVKRKVNTPQSSLPSPEVETQPGPREVFKNVDGQEIWVYYGTGGTYTFWRFIIEVPLGPSEMQVKYRVNNGQEFEFYVPGRSQNMRFAAFSCNGFSSGVNPNDFCGPGFYSGYDPVWTDLLSKHAEEPFHALVGGGDQLYCDGIMREPELQEWVTQTKPEVKKKCTLKEEMRLAIDRFYFNHYCESFRRGAFARANSSIPMLNMLDDHDLIDGFGSYPDDLMSSPVFGTIGARGYFFFLLFQCFINIEVDGLNDRQHPFKSVIIGAPGPFIPFRSHSFLTYLGPQVSMLLLDCRAERKKDQVCSPQEYKTVFERVYELPPDVEHLVILLGIPIAYPRMVFLENLLESKMNPLVALGRAGSLGLSSFVNKFNADAELLDDLNDHWTAKMHKRERNWFIEQLQLFAKAKHCRITFVAGDVHCAAVGVLKTLQKNKKKGGIPPAQDHRYMLNIVTSAIVNTPPPNGVLSMVSALSTKTHRTLHYVDTDETMVPVFERDANGAPTKSKYIMGRRNYCIVNWESASGDLIFELRIEKNKGMGETTGYAVRSPPPRWARS
ncbi:Uncharacterized protein SCP_0410050 [Sparassis crispa]|uniref:PhoD-like phosphatase domain-containing protein n=1 Tax=Sparassis crispa TaxID=139825 RepID=A0A401GKD6_9APHY|nr:Uncharacterized protein SCP_0410050 [Sparassis crispa]GBE82620.1 Uncharacterized protein SCP_0410050 [Sparassis crispa]